MRATNAWAVIGCCLLVAASPLQAAPAKKAPDHPPKPDLADTVQGSYYGDVISDSRGASRSSVTITVTKVAPNTVEVSSSYKRLPNYTVKLTRAMQTIQQASGDNVFLVDRSKTPWRLDVTVDGASWSGEKR